MLDIQIIRALYQSIETGSFVKLDYLNKQERSTTAQTIQRPAIQEPELIQAADPSGKG